MSGNHLTFIDSFQFMSSSLDKVVSNLPKDDLIYTSKVFKGKRFNLMSQKGVYPCNFMDSFEKFNQTELPTKDQFYSILKGELQRQNKLISSERPFKILQNETKIIKIGQAVLEIFNFKDRELDNFTRKNDRKTENVVFLEDLH